MKWLLSLALVILVVGGFRLPGCGDSPHSPIGEHGDVDPNDPYLFDEWRLSEFELLVGGTNYLEGFDPRIEEYEAVLPFDTEEVRVRTVTNDPEKAVEVRVVVDGEPGAFVDAGVGGSDIVVPLPAGTSGLEVWVTAEPLCEGCSGGGSLAHEVAIQLESPM